MTEISVNESWGELSTCPEILSTHFFRAIIYNTTTREFRKALELLGEPFDEIRLGNCYDRISKETVKRLTRHDPKAITCAPGYELQRREFKAKYEAYILETFKPQK